MPCSLCPKCGTASTAKMSWRPFHGRYAPTPVSISLFSNLFSRPDLGQTISCKLKNIMTARSPKACIPGNVRGTWPHPDHFDPEENKIEQVTGTFLRQPSYYKNTRCTGTATVKPTLVSERLRRLSAAEFSACGEIRLMLYWECGYWL